jgi:hypothetical protein
MTCSFLWKIAFVKAEYVWESYQHTQYQNLILNVCNDLSSSRPSHVIVRDFINGERRNKRNARFHSQSKLCQKLLLNDRQTRCLEITSPSFDMQCGNQQEKEASFLRIQIHSNSKALGQAHEREGAGDRQTGSTARVSVPLSPSPAQLSFHYSVSAHRRPGLFLNENCYTPRAEGNWSYATYKRWCYTNMKRCWNYDW